MNIETIQGKPAPDCPKCGGRVIEDRATGRWYTCECAYPEDCPVKKEEVKKDEG